MRAAFTPASASQARIHTAGRAEALLLGRSAPGPSVPLFPYVQREQRAPASFVSEFRSNKEKSHARFQHQEAVLLLHFIAILWSLFFFNLDPFLGSAVALILLFHLSPSSTRPLLRASAHHSALQHRALRRAPAAANGKLFSFFPVARKKKEI